MTRQIRSLRGFSLIEAMVALAIMSFGLLAVANLQISLVSGSAHNKARAEATALAQQKLDELRNYATEPELVANLENASDIIETDRFPDDVAAGDYPQTTDGAAAPKEISGTNATFKRKWTVSGTGDLRKVVVTVLWDDPKEGEQSVSLETEVAWKNTRGMADLGNSQEPAVPNPTGRAKLGDGTATGDEIDPTTNSNAHDNGDGTTTLDRKDANGSGDRVLVDNTTADANGEYQVVLTLEDACLTETGVCQDFVKISGSVYIDESSTLTPAEIQVLASDAAYCARSAVKNTAGTYELDLDGDGVAGETDVPGEIYTGKGNYDYFDYTCYLGGGWYGNIGLLFTGANNNDYACVGDPGNGDAAEDTWKNVELAKRRVYRGLTYLESDWDATEGVATRYWSKGIADETKLPDSTWTGHTHGHDFVVMRATGQSVSAGSCTAPLTREDAVALSLFDGAPGDFICLNADGDTTKHKYLDTLKTGHAAQDACPGNYDPSDPPSVRHTISGKIVNLGTKPLTGLEVNTSDGLENCVVTDNGTTIDYVCNIYNWPDDQGVEIGWIGKILFSNAPYPVVLEKSELSFASTPVITDINPATTVYAHDKLSPYITGTITAPDNDLSFLTNDMITTTDPYGTCQVTGNPDGTATYGCDVYGVDQTIGWTGTVTFAVPPDYNCSTSSYEFTTPVVADSTVPEFTCTGPLAKYTISGRALNGVTNDQGVGLDGDSATNVAPTAVTLENGSCTVTATATTVDYSCDVVVDTRLAPDFSTYRGQLSIVPPTGYWCSTDWISSASVTDVVTSSDTTLADVTCVADSLDIKVKGSVFVRTPYTVIYDYVGMDPVTLAYLGSYDFNADYTAIVYIGPNQGSYEKVLSNIVTLKATMIGATSNHTNGTCEFTSQPSAATSTNGEWFNFSCTTNKPVNRNQPWSGSIDIITDTVWMTCQLGNYSTTYTGVAAGTLIDNAFKVVEDPNSLNLCTPYSAAGPWAPIPAPGPSPDYDAEGLPWTPTMQ